MGLIRAAKTRAPVRDIEGKPLRADSTQGGVALFMVIAAVSILSILVTEFTYIAQINQKIAFDGLDQLKAHYLAKSGLKLSLLRLKAYQNINNYAKGMVKAAGGDSKSAAAMVPKALIDKVWSFPFFYPFPTNIPGMTPADKDKIKAFEKASGLEGRFSANIESESSKYNLNSILAGYTAPGPAPSPTPSPRGSPTPKPSVAEFNPDAARAQLRDFLSQLLQPKMDNDPEFHDLYRDPHLLEDLVDSIAMWADRSFEVRNFKGDIPPKRAPFYSLSELHMIPGMDDDLYNLFAPNLTVSRTPGINVNTMKEPTLKALFPAATQEELTDFFKVRDSEEEDGTFKDEDSFFKYIKDHFAAYSNGGELDKRRKTFSDNQFRFVTDESEFKITVQAQVNQSVRLIEAWVTLTSPNAEGKTPQQPTSPGQPKPSPNPAVNLTGNGTPPPPDPGLKIHFMRVL